jgi:hypothetical protein
VTRALLDRVTWLDRVALFDRAQGDEPDFGLSRRPGWGRRIWLGLAAVFGLTVIIVGLVGIATGPGGQRGGSADTSPGSATRAHALSSGESAPRLGPGLSWHTPSTVVAPGTPLQEQYDQAFSQGLGSLAGMSGAETLSVPTPAVAGGWPRLAVQASPEGWAEVFTAGLLDVGYARQSRSALAGWLQAHEAPELIPGVPPSAADKVLYISLLDPGLFGGQPTPVPSPLEWAVKARSGVTQTASDVMVQVDPGWAQMTAAGWQPPDARMTEEDVSGLLTLRQGRTVTAHRFALQLILGSARWHDGYGTVAVAGWQER